MSSFPIFKVNYLIDKNTIGKIYIFYGKNLENINLNELFESDSNNEVFKKIFTPDELKEIKEKNIEVVFLEEMIHPDDTIGIIKLKISKYFFKPIAEEEIYLYCLQKENFNAISVYQMLTLNERVQLSKIRLDQLLLNIRYENGELFQFQLPQKDKYTFDDILKLDLINKLCYLAKPLGQRIIMGRTEYPFVADPFYVNEYDILLERSRKEISTLNNSILLDTGIISNNNIYLCIAENIFDYCDKNSISIDYTCKIYYPFLYKMNIRDSIQLDEKHPTLVSDNDIKIKSSLLSIENIDMFYDVYKYREPSNSFSLNNKNTGIKNIKIIIHPEYKVKIPIDNIFKLIHANINNPLIKYNPTVRQENMYRLYANKITADGKKIPYLAKSAIFKLMKNIGKTMSVSVYINIQYEKIIYELVCEFEENGQIIIYSLNDFDNVVRTDNNFEMINNIISLAVNPVIDQIKPFFEQSGYKIVNFHSITDNTIEIRDLKFQTTYNITKPINIEKIKGCISSVFNIESYNLSKGIEMRYKRVSNFNKHDSQEAFIIEKQKQNFSNEEIVEQLQINYEDITKEKAYELIDKLINELQVTRGANKKRAIEIKINPGFKTIITLNAVISEIAIIVDNINDLNYLYTIPIYIDTMVRITQDVNSTKYTGNIEKLCSGKEFEDIRFDEITAIPEEIYMANKLPIIEGDTIFYPEYEETEEDYGKMDELLNILGYNEEDDNELLEGGAKDEDESSPSIKSESLESSSPESQINSLESLGSNIQGEIESQNPLENETIQEIEPIKDKSSSIDIESLEFESSSSTPEDIKEIKLKPLPAPIPLSIPSPLIEISLSNTADISNPNIVEKKNTITNKKKILPIFEIQENIEEISPDTTPRVTPTPIGVGKEDAILPIKNDNKNIVKDIEGLKLNNPYLFQERLEEKEPNIFLTLKNGKFDGYSRMCPSQSKRQPVILTKDEIQKLSQEKNNTLMGKFVNDEYNGPDALKYGSSPDNQYYYMCPRYWCLLTNSIVTEKQLKEGVCGGKDAIIPKGAKKVPKGKSIFEFYDDKTTRYPGFHKENTPGGLCIPCCYNSWDKPAQTNRREKCKGDIVNEPKKESTLKEGDQYIKGPEKYPLGANRWGYLPFAIQKFLQEININCQISKNNTNLKPFHTCLLRYGVENIPNQSFISCIANTLFYAEKDEITKKAKITKFIPDAKYEVPSIEIMKTIILKSITIDTFITFQNGDLIEIFSDNTINVDESQYFQSKLYNKIQDISNISYREEKMIFFKKVIQSFENFKLFLLDKTIVIDYTYLWDIICMPNPLLFSNGINLIILEILDNDITNNVELICPTNHYSNNIYDSRKPTLLMIKHDTFFEPIYAYRSEEKRISITKLFTETDPNLPVTLRNVFRKVIQPILKNKCHAFSSKKDIYRFKSPPLLDNLIVNVIEKGYIVETQVLNFQGKVIGIIAKNKKGLSGFIPCFPSSLTNIKPSKCNDDKCNYSFVYMTDDIWKNYNETVKFLKEYYEYNEPTDGSNGKCIDGTDLCKVIEDNVIVGFLTNTNQFVQISVPIPETEIHDNIRKVTSNNYLVADIEIQTTKNIDTKRVDYIKRIELETVFYNVFRNTIRILLNDYINSDKRKKIQEECNSKFVLYDIQLESVISLLKDLCNGYIIFAVKEDSFDYNSIKDIYTCISLSKEKCNNKAPVCMITNDKCSIILPKKNLLTDTDNEIYYYGKMADELIRYNRIKSFIFQPQSYLSFGYLKYNLKDNEIIILQSLLNSEFFENLVPVEMNTYAKYNTFDTAEPITSQYYTNEIKLDEAHLLSSETNKNLPVLSLPLQQSLPVPLPLSLTKIDISPTIIASDTTTIPRICFPSNPENITSIKWKKCFPSNYKEIEYKGKNCGIYMIIDIIKKYNGNDLTEIQIKNILIEEYLRLINNEKDKLHKIADILREQSKNKQGNNIKSGKLNLIDLISAEDYFITNFDLWILLNYFKIPSIFISTYNIPETRFTETQFVCYTTTKPNKEYVFIVVPILKENANISYKLLLNNNKNINISLEYIKGDECINKIQSSIEKYIDIENYISIFTRDIKPKLTPKTKIIPEFEYID